MIKKKIIFILFLLSSCGYQPLFVGKNTNELIFKDINSFGEKNINRKLISISGFKKDEQNFIYSKLTINSKKDIVETSKNAKGKVVSYKMIINLDLTFEDKNKEVKTKSFSESFSYNNLENKFELAEYEKQVENILINKIFEELIIYFNL